MRAASTDDARGVITGVLIAAEDDGVRMVATDSYRLAVRDLPETRCWPAGQKVLVPHRALNELQRILGVERAAHGAPRRPSTPSFEVGGTRLTTRLIEGEYPNYRNLLPSSYPNVLTVGRRRCSRRCGGSRSWPRTPRRCGCTLGGDTLSSRRITQDVGNAVEELDAHYEGDEMTRRRSTPTT